MPDPPANPPPTNPGPLIAVEDADDRRLDLYRNLNDPGGRTRLEADRAVFVVEGRLAVQRLLTSDYTVRSLLVDDHQSHAASDLVAATRARGAPVYVGTRPVVAATVGFALHRGVVAIAERPRPGDSAQLLAGAAGQPGHGGAPPLVAMLEGLNDHENIGALFRNAAAFGVAGVLLDPTCADPLYRRSVRVSVGHVLHVPFARLEPWPTAVRQVREAGFVAVAMAPGEGHGRPATTLAELTNRLSGPGAPRGVALLFGAEGSGLSEAALAASDLVVSLPMAAGVDSLNVATAAAIVFHALGPA